MEAEAVDVLPPAGPEWQYEPKVDGFRCLIFRDGTAVNLQSRNQKPLGRYFPEIEQAVLKIPRKTFVLDGELVIPGQPFDTLQARLHPAESRVQSQSSQFPARFVAFDLLANATGKSLIEKPFRDRRAGLEKLFETLGDSETFLLSKAAVTHDEATKWLKDLGKGLDGIVAKRLDIPYRPGRRAMKKFKVWKTVDCVVGGLYTHANTPTIEYLLLGLYDTKGQLNYVGRCGVQGITEQALAQRLVPLLNQGGGFDGKAPAGENRWSSRQRKPIPVIPKLVVEVSADHVENSRFRHGSRFIRWRPDKSAAECTMDQVATNRD